MKVLVKQRRISRMRASFVLKCEYSVLSLGLLPSIQCLLALKPSLLTLMQKSDQL